MLWFYIWATQISGLQHRISIGGITAISSLLDYSANVEVSGAEMCFCTAILALNIRDYTYWPLIVQAFWAFEWRKEGEGDNAGVVTLEEEGQLKKGKEFPPAKEMSLVVVCTY